MKVVYSMDEVRAKIFAAAASDLGATTLMPGINCVRFIHRYSDGSGETDVENIAEIDRVEVNFDGK